MYYPDEVIEEVRTRNDIVSVISQYVRLTKRGGNYFGVCPFHNEKTPSFSVSPGKQMYYCFGCGAGGNVLTFVMQYENYTFTEAMQNLAERVGITLPQAEETEEQKRQADLRMRLLEVNKVAARYYYYQLRTPAGTHAMEYLKNRNLSDETMQKFGLGYSLMYSDALYRHLKQKGYSDEILDQSGLVKIDERGSRDRFWNRAMFPIMDVNSRVIGFGGRVMGEGEPKYLNSPETKLFDKSRNLYGLNLARTSRRPYFLLCEGYMDVIALHQAGFDCAVASLGTSFTPGHALLIKRYVTEVIITYDSDGAGQKAALRAIPILKNAGLSVRVLNMKPYKDPDEFICALGAEEYQKRIDAAINSFLFETDTIRMRYDFSNPEKKTEFHREVAARLTEFTDELERDNYMEAVAARHQIPLSALREMVNRMGGRRIVTETEAEEQSEARELRSKRKKGKDEGLRGDQRLLLNFITSHPERSHSLRKLLSVECYTDGVYHQIAEMVYADLDAGRTPKPAAVMNCFLDEEEERNQVAAVFNTSLSSDYTEEEQEKILAEAARRVKRSYLDQMVRKETDPVKLQQIIMERAKLESLHIFLD